MRRMSARACVALVTALATLATPVAAQVAVCPAPPVVLQPPTDNRDGYFVNFEEAPVHPMELTPDGSELWVANIPDASVVVFDATVPTQLVQEAVVKVGLGPVTLRHRPGAADPGEMWVVCQSSNAVFIVDVATKRVADTIRLVGTSGPQRSSTEPAGLVFNAAGTKAWVTLSAVNQVLEIDAVARTVAQTLEFSAPFPLGTQVVHGEEPRALLLDGGTLYVLANESGNGSTGATGGLNDDETIFSVWGTPFPPPDIDLLSFPVPGPATGSIAHWRMGTMNFDLQKGPNGGLWVSSLEANNLLEGEHAFKNGNIARHQITFGTPPKPWTQAPGVINLNTDKALTGSGYSCAMPNEMAFTADLGTLYVACYETHNVAVVDTGTKQVVGELRGAATINGETRNFGVRGLVLNEEDGVLYTWTRDNRVQVYQVPVTAGTTNNPSVQTLAVGFDITSAPVRRGRLLNIDATRTVSKVQSCNTCHIDGHMDRIAWDLSDFTGNLASDPKPRVPKRTKVTMSLRGIEETPPFHWRGDRGDLSRFNPAFEGLLGGAQLNAADMADYEAFVFSLAYPANPKQPLDRAPSQEATDGFRAFQCKGAHDIGFLATAALTPTSCAFCHSMTGASGTNNQVNNDFTGITPIVGDATQLRGLFDKESDLIDYSSIVGGHLAKIPATGWGFGNSGFRDTVEDFVNISVFNLLSQPERDDIDLLLDELDTGVAPAAAYAWTLNQATAAQPVGSHPFTTLLQDQAEKGHIDLVVRGWLVVGGVIRPVGMLYDTVNDKFTTSFTGVGPFTYAELVARAGFARGVFTLLGTPRGMGYRLGLDEEMDFLLDGDEAALGAVVGLADTDGDGFPDGYEARLGSNPGSAGSTPGAESVAPGVLAGAGTAWANGSVAKVRWRTDEESRSRVEVYPTGGGPPAVPVAVKEERQFKREHVLVVRGLPPGRSFDVHLVTEDPALPANRARVVLPTPLATPGPAFQNVHITRTTLTLPTSGSTLTVQFQLRDELGNPVPNAVVEFSAAEWQSTGPTTLTTGHLSGASGANGIAVGTYTLANTPGTGWTVEIFATEVTGAQGDKIYFHPLDGQLGFWKQTPY